MKNVLALVQTVASQLGVVTEVLHEPATFTTTFRHLQPCIVVVDLHMPHMEGMEIVRYLAEVGYRGRLIVMSGDGEYGLIAVAIGGASPCVSVQVLNKPFSAAEFQAALLAREHNKPACDVSRCPH